MKMLEYDDDNPSFIVPPIGAFSGEALEVSLEELLKNQIIIAGELQRVIRENGQSLPTKDLKDLITTASAMVSAAHKAGESLRALSTYRTFVDVVVEFIRRRADTLGDDLVAELLAVSREMRAETAARELLL